MKKILSLLSVIILGLTAQAQVTYSGSSSNDILFAATNFHTLQYVTVSSTAADTITFYDSPSSNTTYVIGAYTNTTLGVTTNITAITNYYGAVFNWTNLAITNISVAVAQSTNFYPVIAVVPVTTSPTVTRLTPVPTALRGITASQGAGTNVTTFQVILGY